MDSNGHWVGTWATSPAPSEAGVSFNNHTLRMIPRVSIGGDSLRVRLSNAHGDGKLMIGALHIGIRDKGPAIVPGSERKLTFGMLVLTLIPVVNFLVMPTAVIGATRLWVLEGAPSVSS